MTETDQQLPKTIKKPLHTEHRKRLKARFLSEGLSGFEEHTILELLLFYAIPRRDVNEIAHRLLNRYHSLSGVFEADYEDLRSQKGLGENAALLLRLIPQLTRAYLLDKENRFTKFDTLDEIGNFLLHYYIGETNEVPVMLLLNNSRELISLERLGDGTAASGTINLRRMAELGIRFQSPNFVLAHNHPDGSAAPSTADIETTTEIRRVLEPLGLHMLDHLVIGRSSFSKILNPPAESFAAWMMKDGE